MACSNEKTGGWKRIAAVIQRAGMTTNRFAVYIGLPRGENLYQIKRGNNGISINLADHICKKFPQINKLWLLTGEGEMLVSEGLSAGMFFVPFRGTRRDWFAGIASAGLLAGGCYDNTHRCAYSIADEMETLLTQKEHPASADCEQTATVLSSDNYYWFLSMAMYGLLASRRESTTCEHIKKFADNMYALHSGIGADMPKSE